MEEGADLTATVDNGRTALQLAEQHTRGVMRLLQVKEQMPPVQSGTLVQDNGTLAAVRAVVNAGGGDSGAMALNAAAEDGAIGVAQALLNAGVPVDAQGDGDEPTALMFACQRSHVAMIELLLSCGADVNLTMKSGWSALSLTCDALEAEDVKRDNASPVYIIRMLLAAGAFVNAPVSDGWTPFMLSCAHGNAAAAQELFEANAIVDARADSGESALTAACRNGCLEIAKFLITCGADTNAMSKDGATPLLLAKQCGTRMDEVVNMLIGQELQESGTVTQQEPNRWRQVAFNLPD